MGAYMKEYLEPSLKINEYLFHLFTDSNKNLFDCINIYMSSDIRALMDKGNAMALNKTPKQLYSILGIDLLPNSEKNFDRTIAAWIADVLVYFQWKYAINSKDIINTIDVKSLYRAYYPMHEASISHTADRIYDEYFSENDIIKRRA